jgi:hypothetical protein
MLRKQSPTESPPIPTTLPHCVPDGKWLVYSSLDQGEIIARDKGLHALGVSPVDGSPGHTVTDFGPDSINDLHWTVDNQTLGIVRVHTDSDVVLLRQPN